MESKIIPIQKKNIISTRITSNILTKYEKARILGFRALQLAMNAKSTLKNVKETDCLKIATLELYEKKIPLMIQRHLPDGIIENWYIDEMEIY